MIAPDFTLLDQNGKPFHLYDELASGPILLVFYPRDFSPVCTKQLCDYSDHIGSFENVGMRVVGISTDSVESHAQFAQKHGLSFPLLADADKKVAKAYEITSLFMLGAASRATLIVAKDRKIVHKHVEATVLTRRTTDDLVEVVRKLQADRTI